MTARIKRYDVRWDDGCFDETPDGDWCYHKDVAAIESELKQARDDAQTLRSIVHLAGLAKIGEPRNEFDSMIEKLYDKARAGGVFERYTP
jgi:hypothetical protein